MDKLFIKFSIFALIVGLIISIVGLVTVKGEISLISDLYTNDHLYEEKVFLAEDKMINNIDLSFTVRKIVFNSTDSDTIEIKYFDSERDNLELTENNGKLTVQNNHSPFKFFTSFRYTSLQKQTVIINLPNSINYDIKVWSINGDIIVENVSNISSLNSFAVNSNLTVTGVTNLNTLYSETTNGNSLITNTNINDIDLISINGNLSTSNVSSVDINARTTNGNISIALNANPDLYKIDAHTTNGRIRFNGGKLASGIHQPLGAYNIKVKTTNGNINIIIQ